MVAIGRIANGFNRLLFDPHFQDVITESLTASKKAKGFKNIHTQVKDAFVSAETATKNTSVWGNMKKSLSTLFPDIKNGCKATNGILAKGKVIGKEFWKRMPMLGVLLGVAFELPNIFSAFNDKGIGGGTLEIGKSATRLAAATAGFSIGQALIPIPVVGGLIGAFLGDWLTSKIVGKSHSEKKAEAEAAQQTANRITQNNIQIPQGTNQNTNLFNKVNYVQPTITPQQLMLMQQMLYGNGAVSPMDQDFMAMTSGINRLNYMC